MLLRGPSFANPSPPAPTKLRTRTDREPLPQLFPCQFHRTVDTSPTTQPAPAIKYKCKYLAGCGVKGCVTDFHNKILAAH